MWFGLVLVIMGILLLLRSLGVIISANLWGVFFALVLVAIGASIITRRTKWAKHWDFTFWHHHWRQKEAMESLKRRYARGEISKEEFEKMKEELLKE